MNRILKLSVITALFAVVTVNGAILALSQSNDLSPRGRLTALVDYLLAVENHVLGRNFLEASPINADPGDFGDFGASVAVYGDTALVGAPQADGSKGAAYIFTRSNGVWTRGQKLVAANRTGVLQFGLAVALDGETALIGASGGKSDSTPGSAYVFTRTGDKWQETQKLSAADGAPGDGFGSAVDLDEGLALVGARYANVGQNKSQGAAYLFSHNGDAWGLRRKLTAGDGSADDQFGVAVALYADTAAVGAHHADGKGGEDQGAVYIFMGSEAWREQAQLVAFDGEIADYFGSALDIYGDTLLIGAWNKKVANNPGQGAAYVYRGGGSTWLLEQKITEIEGHEADRFGESVALDNNTALVGATGKNYRTYYDDLEDVGAVTVFTRSGDLWKRQQELWAIDLAGNDLFGSAVALYQDSAVIGAIRAIDNSIGIAGKFYVTERGVQPWLLVDTLQDSEEDGCGSFGYDVALDGDSAVVVRTSQFSDTGTVYFYERDGVEWRELRHVDIDGGSQALALQGDTAVIGAPQADVKGFNSAGAVYVFKREAGTWKDWQKLTADPDQNYEALGAAVALDGDTLFAGAPGKFASGAVIVYVRNGATWQQQPAIKLSDAEEYESLGVSADLDGDTAIVGSSARYGAAYIYRQDGSSWKMQQKLVGSRSLDWDNFGVSVAVDGETAVVGASREDKAYLFQWDGAKWTLGQELEQTDASFSAMGKAVDLYGDMAVVGAVRAKIGADGNQGAVYVFTRGATDWTRTQKILPPPGPKPALFGYPSLDDGRLLVGAPGDDFWCTGVRRFAYFFESAKFVQYIDFPTPSVAGVGNVVPLSAKASSGLPIDYVSNTADTCSVSGSMATMLTRGKCSITASQDGDEKFAAAQNVTVNFATAGDNYRLYLPGVFIDLE